MNGFTLAPLGFLPIANNPNYQYKLAGVKIPSITFQYASLCLLCESMAAMTYNNFSFRDGALRAKSYHNKYGRTRSQYSCSLPVLCAGRRWRACAARAPVNMI